ncbi:sarcosine oxidase subunit gamma [Nocardia sp. NBC_00881]|uniref:sarcosine oxidase subunit gamma n=1 Tax=Nocardia sp. NBC_00881 TaxID=2975995 RepID=UPI0038663928|nr:sarcosine oxidase subunit gamma [Nocardia sp. NBC_00881]
MADTLAPVSPLQGWEHKISALPESLRLSEEPFVAMVDLRIDAPAAAAPVCGVDLPTVSSTFARSGDTTVIWLGPNEWLVTDTFRTGRALEAELRAAVAPHGGAAVDVSAQRTTLRLRGAHARDVLAKGCSLDLHPNVFTTGSAAQTTLARAGIVLLALDDTGTDHRILVRSSFARYLTDWLLDAAIEFSLDGR